MPWYIYNYPLDPCNPNSYSLSIGKPSCAGDTICGIYAQSCGCFPSRPVITLQICSAIELAINGVITEGVTVLRPEFRL